MKGQDDSDPSKLESGDDSYNNKTPLQRIAILLAGPFANFLLAAFLYFCIALMGSREYSPEIGHVEPNSPALKAGLLVGDKIVRINQTDIQTWNDLSKVIKNSQTALKFYVKRDNKLQAIIINPKLSNTQNMFREKVKKRMIGIGPGKVITVQHTVPSSVEYAIEKTAQSSQMIFLGVKKLIQGIIPSSEIGGVITIGKVISDASQSSIIALFSIMALISVNLGVLNLLPIPALDGGHIMFNLYELITRKKPSDKAFIYLTIAGWVILGSLMLLGLYNDIMRFFS